MSEERATYGEPDVSVHAMLRGIRKGKRLTLLNVSEATGVSVSFLSDLERGKTRPSLDTLEKLAAFYGVAVGELFPAPSPDEYHGDAQPIVDEVSAMFALLLSEQTAKGIAHYGGPLTTATDIDPLLEAMKETVDTFVYLVDEYLRRENERGRIRALERREAAALRVAQRVMTEFRDYRHEKGEE